MTLQTPDPNTVTELLPEKKQVPLRGLYLGQDLVKAAANLGRTLVLASFVTDRNGVIAKADARGHFKVPPETRNASDWRLYQELMCQADVTISGGDYLKSVSATGSHTQDVLYQFEQGGEFDDLGEWRLQAGYPRRSPDLAVVSHDLDFSIPERLQQSGRRIAIFTTDGAARSERGKALANQTTVVIGSGDEGVDGNRMVDYLSNTMGARVVMMASGPGVLELLLKAQRLDRLYITEVQREIPVQDPASVKTVLPDGKKPSDLEGFSLLHQYRQDGAVAGDGSRISQFFLRFDRTSTRDSGTG
ncbi:MAG: pyrimidine reductase [Anaerolineae bacterium]